MKRREEASALVIILSLFLSFSTLNFKYGTVMAYDESPLLGLRPFSTDVQNASQQAILNLTISNVTDLYGWQARIYFENAVVNLINASEGPFLASVWDTFWPPPNVDNEFNATHGTALLGCLLIGNVSGVSGSGILATLALQPVGGGNATVHIDTEETILLDSHRQPIAYTTEDAVVSVSSFRNVALMNVLSWKTAVGQGYNGSIQVTVADTGTINETFSVTVYLNTTAVATQTITLANGTSQTIILVCDTSAVAKGRYTVTATVPLLPDEMNATDNTYLGGWINVTVPGDVDGNFWVQLRDLVLLANAYGSHSGNVEWNPNADVDDNGAVGLSDLVLLAIHYGQQL